MRVYPRAYGGTSPTDTRASCRWGLSPRVRGNRPAQSFSTTSLRSIPARTGEPVEVTQRKNEITVYPRAYGGTRFRFRFRAAGRGLSPRVRGTCPADHTE